MKKFLSALLCGILLCSCTPNAQTPKPTPSPEVTSAPEKTMITASGASPISDSWTVLADTSVTLGTESADVKLATTAQRGEDGYMLWDDSQEWALCVTAGADTYVLFNEHIHGVLYIDVTIKDDAPVITLIRTSTVGLSVTEYTYENDAFYSHAVILPEGNGNNIYNSIPEYID